MTEFKPILGPPEKKNGKVSTSEFYRALHQLDEGLTRRFTTLLDAINSGRGEAQQLREDFEGHRKSHPGQSMARQTGKLALLVTFFTAVFTALATVAQRILN